MLQSLKENYFIRSILYHLLKGREAQRKIKGTTYHLYFDAGTNFNFFFKRHLEIENEAGSNLAEITKNNFLVFDVGANIGYYTILFSSYCTNGSVIAMEPDSNNLKYLNQNIDFNKLQNVRIIDKAVSNNVSESTFYNDISTGRTSSLQADAWHPNAAKLQEIKVQTTTIDVISKEYGFPNLIKCDVEGHEIEVLEGASEVLLKRPILFLEVTKKNSSIVSDILKKYGYKIYNAELKIDTQSRPLEEINCQNILCL